MWGRYPVGEGCHRSTGAQGHTGERTGGLGLCPGPPSATGPCLVGDSVRVTQTPSRHTPPVPDGTRTSVTAHPPASLTGVGAGEVEPAGSGRRGRVGLGGVGGALPPETPRGAGGWTLGSAQWTLGPRPGSGREPG